MTSPQPASISPAISTASLLPLKWLFGLLSLALRSGGELTRLAGEMHHTISQGPMPFARNVTADADSAPKTYLLIRTLLEYGADKIHDIMDSLPGGEQVPVPLRRFRSGLNGVMGDKLHHWRHPLAMPMGLVDQEGRDIQLADLQSGHEKGIVLFLHGLCLGEWDWQGEQHQRFVDELRVQGYGVGWLRYNSGLPIWENGRLLSDFLEQHWQAYNGQKLLMIGHSMGGLLVRSACHQARPEQDKHWIHSLTHAAYLASPHAGAPLERIGNFANSLLGVSPYSKPLMALGNIRSLGIRSLRYGNIVAPVDSSQQQNPLPLHEHVEHFLLAARIGDDPAKRWLGDGLVPVDSALGEGHFPSEHERIERVFFDNMGHLRLLQDERTYGALRQWLGLATLH